jgi:release factor glutamine methyltransferase
VTISDALARGTGLLEDSSESPRADALLLLERVLERPRSWIVAHAGDSSAARDAAQFFDLCRRRAAGRPLAYLLGSAGFYGREFIVDESVLVPRPETEHLVDDAIAFIKEMPRDRLAAVLDLGTGSGAIACTIAAETRARVDAVDISSAALEVARENARRLDVAERCRFISGDLTALVKTGRYDVVIANLPYMPTRDIPNEPDPLSFEPRLALDGGPDGLVLYDRLLPALPEILNRHALVLLEAAPPTIVALSRLAATTLKEFVIEVRSDYAGLERYVRASGRPPKGLTKALGER